LAHRLFRGYDLVDRGPLGLCVVALFIGLVQELVDDARALLLLDPSLLRFPLRGGGVITPWVILGGGWINLSVTARVLFDFAMKRATWRTVRLSPT
jgi:hypothetical protein